MRAFAIEKIASLLPSFNGEKKIARLTEDAKRGEAMESIVNTRAYQTSIGQLLIDKRNAGMKELRARVKTVDPERNNGRLEIIDEIEREIDNRIERGRDAKLKLKKIKEEENARRTN